MLSYYFPCNQSRTISYGLANDCGAGGRSAGVTRTGGCVRTGGRAALYPNPATASVDVQTTDATPTNPITVQLFDAYGRPCAEGRSTGAAQVRLPTEALPAGLYFVHLLRGSEVISRQQLRVEK